MAKAEDGTNPDVHIWRIGPTRRDFFGFLGWGAVLTSLGVGTLAFVRFMYPRVLFEPPSRFKLGKPTEYGPNTVSDKWIPAYRFWLVRFDDRFVALSALCTHLGCTPRYLATEDKFKCPCHGSGFRGRASGWNVLGTNYEGPAPRPLERFELSLADDGQLVVDKSKMFLINKGQAGNPGAFLPYA
jgi:cytochrome b6-f complex iron-sulfur subunit